MTTLDRQLYDEYEAEGFRYEFMKEFKAWVDRGCRPNVPEKYYIASRKVQEMSTSGMTYKEISESLGISEPVINNLINCHFTQLGEKMIDRVLG